MNVTLNWLFRNSGSVLCPDEWCKLLDIGILDADGWSDKPMTEPIGLVEFMIRLSTSTIYPL